MKITQELLNAAEFYPYSIEPPLTWCGHIPFASWLIAHFQPEKLVELGTQSGNSYFSFCQAVKENNLSSRCFAVDTWVGEEHTGYYSAEVYRKVDEHNRKNYAGFSTLMRMSFDEALEHFPDASIDLLHIDGLHTYEAVKHDYDAWMPKLSPGAVVLFHDTEVRERDFGVWRLWQELTQTYPAQISFIHSKGLGVIQLPGAPPHKQIQILKASSAEKERWIKFFSFAGSLLLSNFELKEMQDSLRAAEGLLENKDSYSKEIENICQQKDAALNELRQSNSAKDTALDELRRTNSVKDAALNELRQSNSVKDAALNELRQSNSAKDTALNELRQSNSVKDAALNELRQSNSAKDAALDELRQSNSAKDTALDELRRTNSVKDTAIDELNGLLNQKATTIEKQSALLEAKQKEINMIMQSTSMRITAPLRHARQSCVNATRIIAKKNGSYLISSVNRFPRLRQQMISVVDRSGYGEFARSVYAKINSGSSHAHPESLQKTNLKEWIDVFDTPAPEDINRLEEFRKYAPVTLIACFDDESGHNATETARHLVQSMGVDWKAFFIFPDGAETKKWRRECNRALGKDPRIKWSHRVEQKLSGNIVLLMDAALLRPHALTIFAEAFQQYPAAEMICSDQADQTWQQSWFKPEYSELLLQQDLFLGPVVAFSESFATHDLVQDVLSSINSGRNSIRQVVNAAAVKLGSRKVKRIPHILYQTTRHSEPQAISVSTMENSAPKVSVIIPTRDRWDLLGPCLESLKKSNWPPALLESIIVDNATTDPETLAQLEKLRHSEGTKVLRIDEPFNWSRLNNTGMAASTGDILVFLNNDTELHDPDWLHKISYHACKPGIGAVGCKLLYPDLTVQHGGVVTGIQGLAGHAHMFLPQNAGGYCGLANITREITAVTGACLAVSRENFESIGGFDEDFSVAFNDTVFCLALHQGGRRNIYVADPLFIHHESKSRGYDVTEAQKTKLLEEATLARSKFPDLMRDDPLYSPNLSLDTPYDIAFAPRRRNLWDRAVERPPRVMLLSVTHAIGFGVPVVVNEQAACLLQHGCRVFIAGNWSGHDFAYPGCEKIEVNDPRQAVKRAVELNIDVVVPHTPPFFSMAKWTGNYPRVLAYDHGEPPAELFPDEKARLQVKREKEFSLQMAHKIVCISHAVKKESTLCVDAVVRNGNSHYGSWSATDKQRRSNVRENKNWNDRIVIMNVCRFTRQERRYKGVDKYIQVRSALKKYSPQLYSRAIFVLCGKGEAQDIKEMENAGLTVEANVSDEQMYDLYCAADIYMNFSRWEGYNLGIGQALAMGLQVIASDIEAHREFGVPVTDSPEKASEMLAELMESQSDREACVWRWEVQLQPFLKLIDELSS